MFHGRNGAFRKAQGNSPRNGYADIGVADADMWETDVLVSGTVRKGSRPRNILPDAESVVCIAIPLRRFTAIIYTPLPTHTGFGRRKAGSGIGNLGYQAVYVPRDGYHGIRRLEKGQNPFFSHRHAAYLAEMGIIGC